MWPVCFSISCLASLCLWNPVCIVACLFQHRLPGSTVTLWSPVCTVCFSISFLASLWSPVCTVACLFQHQLPGSTVSVESCLHCSLSVSASAAWQHCHTVESCLHCLFQHQLPGSTVESCLQPCRAVNPVCTVACLFQHQLPGITVSVESCLHCGLSVLASASWQHCGVLFALWPVCFSISCLAALCLWNPVCIVACLFQHQLSSSTVESCLQPCRAVNPVLHCGLSVSASAV